MDIEAKQCTKCGETKLLDRFCKHKNCKGGYKSQCKDCERKYRQSPEVKAAFRERDIKYRSLPEVKKRDSKWREQNEEKLKEYQKGYRQQHKKTAREYHRIYYREYGQRPEVKERLCINAANRRARKQSLPYTFTVEQWQHALNYFNGCCAICDRQLNDMFGEFKAGGDHWIPLDYKGDDNPGTVATNIVPLCDGLNGCNTSKGATLPNEWLEWKFGKRKANQIAAKIQMYFDSLEQE